MKHLSAILALAILLTIGLACSDSGSSSGNTTATKNESSTEASVEEVTMKNVSDETVTSYQTSDKMHKIVVKFSEAGPGKVKGVFTAVDAGGEKNFKVLENEVELGTLMNTATFTAKIETGFPAGSYKFDIYVNGKLIKTHNYKVQ